MKNTDKSGGAAEASGEEASANPPAESKSWGAGKVVAAATWTATKAGAIGGMVWAAAAMIGASGVGGIILGAAAPAVAIALGVVAATAYGGIKGSRLDMKATAGNERPGTAVGDALYLAGTVSTALAAGAGVALGAGMLGGVVGGIAGGILTGATPGGAAIGMNLAGSIGGAAMAGWMLKNLSQDFGQTALEGESGFSGRLRKMRESAEAHFERQEKISQERMRREGEEFERELADPEGVARRARASRAAIGGAVLMGMATGSMARMGRSRRG